MNFDTLEIKTTRLDVPVVFFIFNRPDTTELVFNEIAKVKPKKLFVISDGPRLNKLDELDRVIQCRAIIDRVNWDCEVEKKYSESNLGCKVALSSGLNWVFEQVPEAIILEDDCLPNPSFFRFCQEMLIKYRDDTRVGMISGDNFQFNNSVSEFDYYFSRYCHIWGWATWRRAWKFYDVNIVNWPYLKSENFLKSILNSKSNIQHWEKSFDMVFSGQLDTWDHQWTLACWQNKMVSIMPRINLISNIGFGNQATHTHGNSIYSKLRTKEMHFPVRHPKSIEIDEVADFYTAKNMFSNSIFRKILRRIILPYWYLLTKR